MNEIESQFSSRGHKPLTAEPAHTAAGQERMKMATINNKGWFTFTVSALASGDKSFVKRHNTTDIREIARVCETLRESGFARCSRRGWLTLEHPDLGTLQWKSGKDFRTAKEYFILRLNGQPVITAWPKAGEKYTYTKWDAAASSLNDLERTCVERFLGTLQEGTQMRPQDRDVA